MPLDGTGKSDASAVVSKAKLEDLAGWFRDRASATQSGEAGWVSSSCPVDIHTKVNMMSGIAARMEIKADEAGAQIPLNALRRELTDMVTARLSEAEQRLCCTLLNIGLEKCGIDLTLEPPQGQLSMLVARKMTAYQISDREPPDPQALKTMLTAIRDNQTTGLGSPIYARLKREEKDRLAQHLGDWMEACDRPAVDGPCSPNDRLAVYRPSRQGYEACHLERIYEHLHGRSGGHGSEPQTQAGDAALSESYRRAVDSFFIALYDALLARECQPGSGVRSEAGENRQGAGR